MGAEMKERMCPPFFYSISFERRSAATRCYHRALRRSGGMADAGDSKSPALHGCVGSTPTSGTILVSVTARYFFLSGSPSERMWRNFFSRSALARENDASPRASRGPRGAGSSGAAGVGSVERGWLTGSASRGALATSRDAGTGAGEMSTNSSAGRNGGAWSRASSGSVGLSAEAPPSARLTESQRRGRSGGTV
jgi:hypothetical protein